MRQCATYSTSKQTCRSFNASLPTVKDPAQAYYIETVSNSSDTWIGLTDNLQEGNWTWESGSNSTYRKWLPNKPNDGLSENCAVVNGRKSNATHSWVDRNCSQCNNVTCEQGIQILLT